MTSKNVCSLIQTLKTTKDAYKQACVGRGHHTLYERHQQSQELTYHKFHLGSRCHPWAQNDCCKDFYCKQDADSMTGTWRQSPTASVGPRQACRQLWVVHVHSLCGYRLLPVYYFASYCCFSWFLSVNELKPTNHYKYMHAKYIVFFGCLGVCARTI